MKKLNVAIIGCGRISVVYDTAFHKLADRVNVVYAVDKDEKKAKEFADKFGCAYATDFEQIADKDIDVLHICLPHYLHAPMAMKAMRAGMNVLTEKPVAMTLQEADLMKQVQKETGKKLGVIFQTRYTTGVQRLKKMIEEGTFGKIISARSMLTWSRTEDYYKSSDWKGTWDGEGGGAWIECDIWWEVILHGLKEMYPITLIHMSKWKILLLQSLDLKMDVFIVFMQPIHIVLMHRLILNW